MVRFYRGGSLLTCAISLSVFHLTWDGRLCGPAADAAGVMQAAYAASRPALAVLVDEDHAGRLRTPFRPNAKRVSKHRGAPVPTGAP